MVIMLRLCGVSIWVAVWLAATAPAGAQEVRTQAPCSPVIDRTQGNVTINFMGGCTVGITAVQLTQIIASLQAGRAIPPELLDRYDALSQKFGVTDAAVANFFRILGEVKVPIEDLDAKLREIAAQHLTLLKQTEAQAGDDPKIAALKNDAVTAIGAGDYARAQTLLEQVFDAGLAAAKKAQDVVNQRYVAAAKAKADLGRLKMAQLRYAAAAQDFRIAADLVPTSEPLIRAEHLIALGVAAVNAGNYPLAHPALSEALGLREKALAPDDTSISESMKSLAVLDTQEGHYVEAESLSKRALAIDEKVLGPHHPDVAVSLTTLAVVYRAQGRYAEAESLAKRALAIGEKTLGADSPPLAIYLNNLGELAEEQGRNAEAESFFERALAIGEKARGTADPFVARMLNNLATVYDVQGRRTKAESIYKRAIAMDEKVLGPEHPDVATTLGNLAALYKAQNRYGEAEPLLKRAIAIHEEMLGPEHPDLAYDLHSLGAMYQIAGRLAEAEPLLRRALAIDEKALGPEDPQTKEIRAGLESLPHPPPAQSGVTSSARRDR